MRYFFLLSFIFISNVTYAQQLPSLIINEVMPYNTSAVADHRGDYHGWIEFYNPTDTSLALSEYSVTLGDDQTWNFPELTIEAEGFVLVWFSGESKIDTTTTTSEESEIDSLHVYANLKFPAHSVPVYITHASGDTVDVLNHTDVPDDESLGRSINDSDNWYFFSISTPGQSNISEGYQKHLDPPVFSHDSGFYSKELDIRMSVSHPNAKIFFTKNGALPSDEIINSNLTRNVYQFTSPVRLRDRYDEENVFSLIRTNHISAAPRDWRPPESNVPKSNVITAQAYLEGYFYSKAISAVYFISDKNQKLHDLPVISISTNPQNLFDDSLGIYVPGITYDGNDNSGNYYLRGIETERVAHLEMFDKTGARILKQITGVRIHGGHTRRFPQKSLRLYARSEYGESHFNAKIFPDHIDTQFKRLLLRGSGNDWNFSMMMDATAQSLVSNFNFDTQAYQPAVLYLNGEYWGIHNIRERYDKHYLERVYGIDPENIDLLSRNGTISEGDNVHYRDMQEFIRDHDLSIDKNYRHVETLMDIDNFVDYYSAQIYFGNNDWPHGNIDYWRSKVSYNPDAESGHDGRWRWLLYDVDRSLGFVTNENFNMVEWAFAELSPRNNQEWPNLIIRNLFENAEFKALFLNRVADHLNTAFHPDVVKATINEKKSHIAEEMYIHRQRWPNIGSYSNWSYRVSHFMVRYAKRRPNNVFYHFSTTLDIPNFSLEIEKNDNGRVTLNSLNLNDWETNEVWRGRYFQNVPINLMATPEVGYVFSHWSGVPDSLKYFDQISLAFTSSVSIEAVFKPMVSDNLDFVVPSHSPQESPFKFSNWPSDTTAGVFPPHMAFVYMDRPEPGLGAKIAGMTSGAYNLNNRTRINGLGDDGISFLNTSNLDGNPGYPGQKLGGALIALDTREADQLFLNFTASTISQGKYPYNLRVLFRTSEEDEFLNVLDTDRKIIEYISGEDGHRKDFDQIHLSEGLIGQEYLQLFFQYYYTGNENPTGSGRTEIGLHEITVSVFPDLSPPSFNSPELDSVSANNSIPISWTAKPHLNDYQLRVFQKDSVNIIIADTLITGTEFLLSNVIHDHKYAVKLRSVYADTKGEWSEIYTFHVSYPMPQPATLVFPEDSYVSESDSIVFRWTPLEYVTNYELVLSSDADFKQIVTRDTTSRTELKADGLADGEVYFWRVRGLNPNQTGDWSDIRFFQISVSADAELDQSVPETFELSQNFPNPFNPVTTIRYGLPKSTEITLTVYNSLGQRVGVIDKGLKSAGYHAVQFDASHLTSGVYYYQITHQEGIITRKMLLIK